MTINNLQYNAPTNRVNAILQSGNVIYIASGTGIFKIDIDTLTTESLNLSIFCTSLAMVGTDLYVGTFDGIRKINTVASSGELEVTDSFGTTDNLYRERVTSLAYDGTFMWISYAYKIGDSPATDKITKYNLGAKTGTHYATKNFGTINQTTQLIYEGSAFIYAFDSYCFIQVDITDGSIDNFYCPVDSSTEVFLQADLVTGSPDVLYFSFAEPVARTLKYGKWDCTAWNYTKDEHNEDEVWEVLPTISLLEIQASTTDTATWGDGSTWGDAGLIWGGLLAKIKLLANGGLYRMLPNVLKHVEGDKIFLGMHTDTNSWGAIDVKHGYDVDFALANLLTTSDVAPQDITAREGDIFGTRTGGLIIKLQDDSWAIFQVQDTIQPIQIPATELRETSEPTNELLLQEVVDFNIAILPVEEGVQDDYTANPVESFGLEPQQEISEDEMRALIFLVDSYDFDEDYTQGDIEVDAESEEAVFEDDTI